MPAVSAITSIGHDHQQYLGDTIAAIAAEKAGIIKPGVPVVIGDLPVEAGEVVRDRAAAMSAPLIEAAIDSRIARVEATTEATRFDLVTPMRDYGTLSLALRGRHQVGNAVVAIRVLETLSDRFAVDEAAIRRGLAKVQWPGRLEQIALSDGRTILLDAAHNPEGAAVLAEFLAAAPPARPLVFAAMRDKDVTGILRQLLPAVSSVVITRASNPRSAPPFLIEETVRALTPGLPVMTTETPAEALAAAWQRDRSIVAAGSIFLIGDLLKEVQRS
jgi:dihydrofolate synthase/folylpolyglutamate synthase